MSTCGLECLSEARRGLMAWGEERSKRKEDVSLLNIKSFPSGMTDVFTLDVELAAAAAQLEAAEEASRCSF